MSPITGSNPGGVAQGPMSPSQRRAVMTPNGDGHTTPGATGTGHALRKSSSVMSKESDRSSVTTKEKDNKDKDKDKEGNGHGWRIWGRKHHESSSKLHSSASESEMEAPDMVGSVTDAPIAPNSITSSASVHGSNVLENSKMAEEPVQSESNLKSQKNQSITVTASSPVLSRLTTRKRASTSLSTSPTRSSFVEPSSLASTTAMSNTTTNAIPTNANSAAAAATTTTVKPKRFSGITHVGRRVSVSTGSNSDQQTSMTGVSSMPAVATSLTSPVQQLPPPILVTPPSTRKQSLTQLATMVSPTQPRSSIFIDAVMTGVPMPISVTRQPSKQTATDTGRTETLSTMESRVSSVSGPISSQEGRQSILSNRLSSLGRGNDNSVDKLVVVIDGSDRKHDGGGGLSHMDVTGLAQMDPPGVDSRQHPQPHAQIHTANANSVSSDTNPTTASTTTSSSKTHLVADTSSTRPHRAKTITRVLLTGEMVDGDQNTVVQVTLTPPRSSISPESGNAPSPAISDPAVAPMVVETPDSSATITAETYALSGVAVAAQGVNELKSSPRVSGHVSDASGSLSQMSVKDAGATGDVQDTGNTARVDADTINTPYARSLSSDKLLTGKLAPKTTSDIFTGSNTSVDGGHVGRGLISLSSHAASGSAHSLGYNEDANIDSRSGSAADMTDDTHHGTVAPNSTHNGGKTSPSTSSAAQKPRLGHDMTVQSGAMGSPVMTRDRASTSSRHNKRASTREPHLKDKRAFVSLFPEIRDAYTDFVNSYTGALERDILWHGRIYITRKHICFYASLFGQVTKLVLEYGDMRRIEKKATAGVFPNAIRLTMVDGKSFVFSSLLKRDATFDVMETHWIRWKELDGKDDYAGVTGGGIRGTDSTKDSLGNGAYTEGAHGMDDMNGASPVSMDAGASDTTSATNPYMEYASGSSVASTNTFTSNLRKSNSSAVDRYNTGTHGSSPDSDSFGIGSPDAQLGIAFPDLRKSTRRSRAASELRPIAPPVAGSHTDGQISPAEMFASQPRTSSVQEMGTMSNNRRLSRNSTTTGGFAGNVAGIDARGKVSKRSQTGSNLDDSNNAIAEVSGSAENTPTGDRSLSTSPPVYPFQVPAVGQPAQTAVPRSHQGSTFGHRKSDSRVNDNSDDGFGMGDEMGRSTSDDGEDYNEHAHTDGNNQRGDERHHPSQRQHRHHHHAHGQGQQLSVQASELPQRRSHSKPHASVSPVSPSATQRDRASSHRHSHGQRRPSFLWKQMVPTEPVVCGCEPTSHYTTVVCDAKVPLYVDTAFDVLFGVNDAFWTRRFAQMFAVVDVRVGTWAPVRSGALVRELKYVSVKADTKTTSSSHMTHALVETSSKCVDHQRLVRNREFYYYVVDCRVAVSTPAASQQPANSTATEAPTIDDATGARTPTKVAVTYRLCLTHIGPHLCRVLVTCQLPENTRAKLEPGWREFGKQIVQTLENAFKPDSGSTIATLWSVSSIGDGLVSWAGSIGRRLGWTKQGSEGSKAHDEAKTEDKSKVSVHSLGGIANRAVSAVLKRPITATALLFLMTVYLIAGSTYRLYSGGRQRANATDSGAGITTDPNANVGMAGSASLKKDAPPVNAQQKTSTDVRKLLRSLEAQVGYRLTIARDRAEDAWLHGKAVTDALRRIHETRGMSWAWAQSSASTPIGWPVTGSEEDVVDEVHRAAPDVSAVQAKVVQAPDGGEPTRTVAAGEPAGQASVVLSTA